MTEAIPAWHRDDYEKSCTYATEVMREREIRAGRLLPRPDHPEEVRWHEDWKAGKVAEAVV